MLNNQPTLSSEDLKILAEHEQKRPNQVMIIRQGIHDFGPYLLRPTLTGLRLLPICERTAWSVHIHATSKAMGHRVKFRSMGSVEMFADTYYP